MQALNIETFLIGQGFLDVKYLHHRYERGVKAVKKFMDDRHRYVQIGGPGGLREAQADLTSFKREQGDGFWPHLRRVNILEVQVQLAHEHLKSAQPQG